MEDFSNFEESFRDTKKLLEKINQAKENLRQFLFPNELEEYDELEAKAIEGSLSTEGKKKIIFYRHLADGMTRQEAERISDLQVMGKEGELSQENKDELRRLRFYKELVLETDKGFSEKDANEYFDLTIKEDREGTTPAEKEKLLFYRCVTNEDLNFSREEASRLAKLQVMNEYGLLDENQKEEMRKLRSEGRNRP